jgi:hypothetical protein
MLSDPILSKENQSFDSDDVMKQSGENTASTTPINDELVDETTPPLRPQVDTKYCTSALVRSIDDLFLLKNSRKITLEEFNAQMLNVFSRIDLSTNVVNKYTFWDSDKPYTRNLIALGGRDYTLLLLCWTAGKESKIHDHPGEGCFMKVLRGCIRESRYKINSDGEINPIGVKFLSENQSKSVLTLS